MLRALMLSTVLVVLAAAFSALPTAQAQGPTGSISGRVFDETRPNWSFSYPVWVMPAGVPMPLKGTLEMIQYTVISDTSGNFTAGGLADGDYLIGIGNRSGIERILTPMPETFSFTGVLDSQLYTVPAMRVTIANGEALEGIDILIRLVPIQQLPDGQPTATPTATATAPQVTDLPSTGQGAYPGSRETRFLFTAAMLAAVGSVVLAGSTVARHVRKKRTR
jgi:hypothetical protein